MYYRECKVCGKKFVTMAANKMTCSVECRKANRSASSLIKFTTRRLKKEREERRSEMLRRLSERDRKYAADYPSLTRGRERGRIPGGSHGRYFGNDRNDINRRYA